MNLQVSENQRFLTYEDGTPFFYLADTAWELLHRLDREETDYYLSDRAEKGFTVIQTVILAELQGMDAPNAEGHLPLHDNDPTRPNEAYFEHVDWAVDRANEMGLWMGLLPTWGDKWNIKGGSGPEIFTPENARVYGEFLGRRYRAADVIWILGGDRALETPRHWSIMREMAAGLREGDGGAGLITYHPGGDQSFVKDLPKEPWLDFTMIQSSHVYLDEALANYRRIAGLYDNEPTKPCMDGEPCYEDIPVMTPEWKQYHNFWFDDYHARRAAYWSLFSGAFGHTYGAHPVWQMWTPAHEGHTRVRRPWYEGIELPGSTQMGYVRQLMESRPFLTRIPDQGLISKQVDYVTGHIVATRDEAGTYAFIYTANGEPIELDLGAMGGERYLATWYDPRTGKSRAKVEFDRHHPPIFYPPQGGPDWVLIVDDVGAGYPRP